MKIWFRNWTLPTLTTCRSAPPPHLKKSRFPVLVQNYTRCSETNKKYIFPILIFWVINDFVLNFQMFLTDQKGTKCLKRFAMFWNGFLYSWVLFLCNFQFMSYSQFRILPSLCIQDLENFRHFFYVMGLGTPKSPVL